ncbi:hypothetical protein BC835DRAFT_699107 [Cytidiella melzeri]|nr:hypothetical protein BC835DRAFT_699107 [Cytidiella melzeri]
MTSADTSYRSLGPAHHFRPHNPSTTSRHRPLAGRSSSTGAQSHSSSTAGDPVPQTSPSMNVPINYYDPDQAIVPDETEQYQQWVQNYYAQAQSQAPYAQPEGMPIADMSQLPYETPAHTVGSSSMPPQEHPPPMQNQYNFVQSQYMVPSHQNTNLTGFHQQLPSSRSLDRGAPVPPSISRQVSHPNTVNRNSFRTTLPMGYQQRQPQTQYPASYFPPQPNASDGTRDQEFAFSFQPPSVERTTPASVEGYTSNSETRPLSEPNASQSSWGGADQSAQYNAYVSTGPAPSTSPSARRDTPGKRKNNKRQRLTTSVEPTSESEDEDGPQPAVPPLRGPDMNATRLPGACTHCKKLKVRLVSHIEYRGFSRH